METKNFESIKDLMDEMKQANNKVWIKCDDPIHRIVGVMDENFNNRFSISLPNFKMSEESISIEERVAFFQGNFHKFGGGVELTAHQRFCLSDEYWFSMGKYLTTLLELKRESLSRKNRVVDKLENGSLPVYDISPHTEAYFVEEEELTIAKVKKGRNKMMLPLFEIESRDIQKGYKSVWDIKIDDFLKGDLLDGFIKQEDALYESIQKFNPEKIIQVERGNLTTLPITDFAKGEFGFTCYLQTGIGFLKKEN